MSDLKPLVCPNRGGKINSARMKCEYCGTEFRRDDSAIRGFVMDEMIHRLAQALVPMMDITVQDNPHFNSVDVRGRIRVIKPDYRY